MTATQQKFVNLEDLHFEHRLWLNELDFAKDEMGSLTKRLKEVEAKNTDEDCVFYARHFHNRLNQHKQTVGDLRHAIKEHESALAHQAEEHPIAIDHVYFTDHTVLRRKMTYFTTLYGPFKIEFMNFIAKWM
jgi:succinate dehydrogenase/fumarate reductase flavoprotein subunit